MNYCSAFNLERSIYCISVNNEMHNAVSTSYFGAFLTPVEFLCAGASVTILCFITIIIFFHSGKMQYSYRAWLTFNVTQYKTLALYSTEFWQV